MKIDNFNGIDGSKLENPKRRIIRRFKQIFATLRSVRFLFITMILSATLIYLNVENITNKASHLKKTLRWGRKEAFERLEFFSIPKPTALNNTKKAEIDLVVFNRVPKVGSEMMKNLMVHLGKRNNFSVFYSVATLGNMVLHEKGKELRYAQTINNLPRPSALTKHFTYVDFAKHNLPKPIYVNLVRDPVERIISWFYYIRAPQTLLYQVQNRPKSQLPSHDWLNKDFGACVLTKDEECSFVENSMDPRENHRRQNIFFCGADPECIAFNSQSSLDRAKRNVENEFAVVGTLEDLNMTLAVLEKYIPRFFAGALETYYKNAKSLRKSNQNNFKPCISNEIKNLVRKNLSKEIEFFEFCRNRLKLQHLAVFERK